MKRFVCILLVAIICLSVTVPCAAGETRIENDERIKEFALNAMRLYRDYYDSLPAYFDDAQVIALYEYYMMYHTASYAYIAETSAGTNMISFSKQTLAGEMYINSILNETMLKWLNGEIGKDEVVDVLMRVVNSTIESNEKKGTN